MLVLCLFRPIVILITAGAAGAVPLAARSRYEDAEMLFAEVRADTEAITPRASCIPALSHSHLPSSVHFGDTVLPLFAHNRTPFARHQVPSSCT
jgi:hypothetical protein